MAMRPDSAARRVLGISPAAGTTTDGYALINQSGPGAGLQDVTLPFKGVANHYALAGGTAVADALHLAHAVGGPARGRPLQPDRHVVVRPGAQHRLHPAGRSGVRRSRSRRSAAAIAPTTSSSRPSTSSGCRCRTPTCRCACSAASSPTCWPTVSRCRGCGTSRARHAPSSCRPATRTSTRRRPTRRSSRRSRAPAVA